MLTGSATVISTRRTVSGGREGVRYHASMFGSPRSPVRACICVMLTAVALALAAQPAGLRARAGSAPDLFDELYRRGQERNGDLRTFTAAFTETTESTLLTKPLVARGTVAVERPARVALRYTEPDERVVIIDGDRLTIALPSRGVRQTRDIGAAQKRVQKYFVDSSPGELRSHFEITAAKRSDRDGYAVTLVPKRKQIREGLSRLDLGIDSGTLLLDSMEMTFPNGDVKRMTFTDVKPNAAIEPDVFALPDKMRERRREEGEFLSFSAHRASSTRPSPGTVLPARPRSYSAM
jgi:outer membrane lipoprotein-sorting protein